MVDNIWAITSYFNPMHWQRRRANYHTFRRHLPFPLIAVELGFDNTFDLVASDAERLLQITGGDVMWQKERLLNLALDALPSSCNIVLWIDCDVVFQQANLQDKILRTLQVAPLVQLFSLVHDLPSDGAPADWPARSGVARHSIPNRLAQGMTAAECLGKRHPGPLGVRSPGHAWAIRKELIENHRFYDRGIVGGGDEAIACAAYGVFSEVIRLEHMNQCQAQRYLAWAEPFFASIQGNVAMIPGNLLHLWHGEPANRRWFERHSSLAQFHFDPDVDIAQTSSGCWRWNTVKPELHQYVRDYFASRSEDSSAAPAA
jgi:hypothetical protein